MKKLVGIGMSLFLFSCGAGEKGDLEAVRAKLASGNQSVADGLLARIESGLENSTGERRLEWLELYVGAQLSRAGFNPIRFTSHLLHKSDEETTVQAFRNALSPVSGGAGDPVAERLAILEEAAATVEAITGNLQGDDPEAGYTSRAASATYTAASEEFKRRVDIVTGNLHFITSLFVLIDASGFNIEDDFTLADCDTALTEKLSVFGDSMDLVTYSLFRARWFYERSGLDDLFFSTGPENHDLVQFVEDLQLEFDAATRAAIDGDFIVPDPADQVDDICQYLDANQ